MIPRFQSKHKRSLKLFDRGVRIFVLIVYLLSTVGMPTLAVHAGIIVQGDDDQPDNRTTGYMTYLPLIMGGLGTMPTDIILDNNTIEENLPVDTVIGTLSTDDPGVGDTHTYSLVSGVGDDDNASFNISGDELRTSEIFNYELQNSYSIRIQTMDQDGLKYQESFTIDVLDVDDLPVADDQTVSTVQNQSVNITLNGSDEDGDVLEYLIVTLPAHGVLYENGDPLTLVTIPQAGGSVRVSTNLVFEPDEDFWGVDSFDFKILANEKMSNVATVTINVNDVTAPTLNITGATADGELMSGDLETGFVLETTNVPEIDHMIQFADGTDASEPLKDEYFGLSLVNSTVSAAALEAYYIARDVQEPFLSYLIDAAYGNEPFVYIKGTTVRLVDAAKWDLLAEEHDMTVPDDFPLGTYTVEGQIEDEAGNPTTVTLILVVSGDRVAPELLITGATDNGSPMAGDLETGFVLETTNVPEIDHLIQFADGSDASEPLKDEYFGLSLVDSTVSAAKLAAYYVSRGVQEPFLSYLIDAAYGNEPFVYIKGTTVRLVDAAKWDLLAEEHDMTVPDDFPLGTYTVAGQIEDEAGNSSTVTLILVVSGDRVAPELTVTGATADDEPMPGDLETGFVLETTNVPEIDHLIQFADGTDASEPLADEYFGLSLVDSTVSAAELEAYYIARGVPAPFLSYLVDAAYGNEPFVYIKGTTVRLVDAAKWDLLGEEHDMTVPDDFPLGTYTVEGQIEDEAGNPTTVTLILVVSGDRVGPELTITGATADGELMSGDLETGYVLETTNVPEIDHLIQFADGTEANEPLVDEYFGLSLVDSTVSAAELEAYYIARGVPAPFLSYLIDAAYGNEPFVYIKGTTVRLVDAAKWDLLGEEHDMTVPDDFPLGTYTVEGEIVDLAGNPTTVTLILVVDDFYEPTLRINIDHEEGILSGDWEGDNGGGFVGVSADAALAGTDYGLWADSGEGTSQYAYLNFPEFDTDIMRLRFYIDVQNVTPSTNTADYMHIIGVKSSNETNHICYIMLRYKSTGFYIQLDAKEDGDTDYPLTSSGGSISASAENYVEVVIVRGDSGLSNGEAYLWVNGVLEDSATDLNNDQQFTNLGFIEAGVFHKNGIWAGNVYIDEIRMNSTGDEIGPL